jgi:hypothetical protein
MLAILSKKEFRELGLWLQSPWANTNKKLVDLYQILQKQHPDFTDESLESEGLSRQLYPDKPFDDKQLRNLKAAFCKQAARFLAHQRLERDELLHGQLLAKVYLEKHETEWHEKVVEELVATLEAKQEKGAEEHLQLALLLDELYQRPSIAQHMQGQAALLSADRYLDSFYATLKWRHVIEMNERRLIMPEEALSVNEDIVFLEAMTARLNLPVLNVYQKRLRLAYPPTQEGFSQFKEVVFSEFEALPDSDRRLVFYYLINMAIQLWLKGHVQIMGELLDLYQWGLKEGVFLHHGRLPERTFSNIVTTANSLGQFDFTLNFIHEYKSKLSPDLQEDGGAWSMAHTFYRQNRFDECISLLSRYRFTGHVFALQSKALLMQAYFEMFKKDTSYYLFLMDFVDAFRKYAIRNQFLSPDRRAAMLNFIRYTAGLAKQMIAKKLSLSWLEAYEARLNEEQKIQGKQWVLEKLAELKNGLPK